MNKTVADMFSRLANANKIRNLKQALRAAGDRRDSYACDRLEAELYKLTGDESYAPYKEEE